MQAEIVSLKHFFFRTTSSYRPACGAVDTITKTGVVIYRGALCGVRDDGQRLRIDGGVAPAVLAQALRLAATRYGSALRVEGDAAFTRAVVDAAVAHGVHVTFDDPALCGLSRPKR